MFPLHVEKKLQMFQKSKWQFTMGIYNARAAAAFLGMELENIYLYSGYRKDNLSSMQNESLIALRASNNRDKLKEIKLNQDGDGTLCI